jgi:hypothetical protein
MANRVNGNCFRGLERPINETDTQKKSTVESSHPNVSGFIDTGMPSPIKMVAEEPIFKFVIRQS